MHRNSQSHLHRRGFDKVKIDWLEMFETKDNAAKELAKFITKDILKNIQPIIFHRTYLICEYLRENLKKEDLIK